MLLCLSLRAKEAEQLREELVQARMSEKMAKDTLLEVTRSASPNFQVTYDTGENVGEDG